MGADTLMRLRCARRHRARRSGPARPARVVSIH